MKKKLLALILAFALALSAALPASASAVTVSDGVDFDTMEKSMKVVTDAIDEMEDIFPDAAAGLTMADIFNGFVAASRIASPIFGTINGSVTFLKLIGVLKDANAEMLADILSQLQTISEDMAAMDEKLNQITAEMAKMQASSELNARTEKAILLQQNWKDFQARYAEDGMDALMTEYTAMLLGGMKKWCLNTAADARVQEQTDNTRIILHYVPTEDGYAQVYEAGVVGPDDFAAEDRYLVLSADLLPASIAWNVNTYRSDIADCITENLRKADTFVCGNFPAFSGESELTDELLEQTAEDAVNVLVYRVAAAAVNKDAAFALQVQRQFANYCSHLLAAEEGMDAIFKSFCLTHAFEYQIAEEFRTFCNEMALKTGTYGAFAANILGMSEFVTEREKTAMLDTYCDTLIAIGEAKSNGLTGEDNYCYLTNTVLSLDEVTFTTNVSVDTRTRGTSSAYEGYSASPIEVVLGGSENAGLIGDTNALLLIYVLRSNGIAPDFDYLAETLGVRGPEEYGTILTTLNREQSLSLSSTMPMRTTLILGDYFKNGASVSLNRLPEDADSDYIVCRKMISGSILRPDTGSIAVNQVLTGTAIYGESHFYWEDDESAILGGPTAQKSFTGSVNKKQTDVDVLGQHYYTSSYEQSVSYNCLMSEPLPRELNAADRYNPLAAYRALCEDLAASAAPRGFTGTLDSKPTTSALPFVDVTEEDWFCDSVKWAYAKGITGGTDATHFSPFTSCTRAQAITFLWRAAGRPAAAAAIAFGDVAQDAYYASAVCWAVSAGITTGTAETTFSPDDVLTREQLAALLFRYAKASGDTSVSRQAALHAFTDADDISLWAKEAVSWCAAQGILEGTDGGRLAPKDIASRAAVAAMLCRTFGK